MKKLYLLYKKNPRLKQVITLYSVNIITIPISIVSSIIITNFLGPTSYGDFKFLLNIFNLVIVIFSFGFFQAGNRALVLNNNKKRSREIYGAELIIVGFLFLIAAAFLLCYNYFDKNINEKGLNSLLLGLIPFTWVFFLIPYFQVLFQADNRINLLAISNLYPKILFLISVGIIHFTFFNYTGNRLIIIWIFFLITQIFVFSYIIHKLKPSFKNLRVQIHSILSFNKTYGFNVYLGSIFAVGFSQLSGILISYFSSNNSGVGFYSLALTISGPLSFIPNVIATTHYKDFSTINKIPQKLIMITLFISIFVLLLVMILIGPFIQLFYGLSYWQVIPLTYIACFGTILNGSADFLNRFLGSHGRGRELRNGSIIVGFSLLILNIILIPKFGETGAAYTLLLSGIIYFSCMLFFYKKLVYQLKIRAFSPNS